MEEDIKILENVIVEYSTQVEDYKYYTVPVRLDERDIQAIENLIKRNKELEEKDKYYNKLIKLAQTITDESLKEALEEFEKDYIPKSKIKEKIEELNKEEQEAQNSISDEEREEYSDANISYILMDIETRRRCYKELLGEEK